MNRRKGVSIYLMEILFALVPLMIGAIVLTIAAVSQLNSNLVEGAYERLEVAAIGAANYFEYDIQNGIIAQDSRKMKWI